MSNSTTFENLQTDTSLFHYISTNGNDSGPNSKSANIVNSTGTPLSSGTVANLNNLIYLDFPESRNLSNNLYLDLSSHKNEFIGTSGAQLSADVSISFWTYFDALETTGTTGNIFHVFNTDSFATVRLIIENTSQCYIEYELNVAGTQAVYLRSELFTGKSTWNHLCVRTGRGKHDLFVNSVKSTHTDISISDINKNLYETFHSQSDTKIYIGHDGVVQSNKFRGKLGDLCIFSRFLDMFEIMSLNDRDFGIVPSTTTFDQNFIQEIHKSFEDVFTPKTIDNVITDSPLTLNTGKTRIDTLVVADFLNVDSSIGQITSGIDTVFVDDVLNTINFSSSSTTSSNETISVSGSESYSIIDGVPVIVFNSDNSFLEYTNPSTTYTNLFSSGTWTLSFLFSTASDGTLFSAIDTDGNGLTLSLVSGTLSVQTEDSTPTYVTNGSSLDDGILHRFFMSRDNTTGQLILRVNGSSTTGVLTNTNFRAKNGHIVFGGNLQQSLRNTSTQLSIVQHSDAHTYWLSSGLDKTNGTDSSGTADAIVIVSDATSDTTIENVSCTLFSTVNDSDALSRTGSFQLSNTNFLSSLTSTYDSVTISFLVHPGNLNYNHIGTIFSMNNYNTSNQENIFYVQYIYDHVNQEFDIKILLTENGTSLIDHTESGLPITASGRSDKWNLVTLVLHRSSGTGNHELYINGIFQSNLTNSTANIHNLFLLNDGTENFWIGSRSENVNRSLTVSYYFNNQNSSLIDYNDYGTNGSFDAFIGSGANPSSGTLPTLETIKGITCIKWPSSDTNYFFNMEKTYTIFKSVNERNSGSQPGMSFCFWIYPILEINDTSNRKECVFCLQQRRYNWNFTIELQINGTTEKWRLLINFTSDESNAFSYTTNYLYDVNTWNHVSVSIGSGSNNIYINGVQDIPHNETNMDIFNFSNKFRSGSLTSLNQTMICIGQFIKSVTTNVSSPTLDASRCFHSAIADFHILDRSLTYEQSVQQLMTTKFYRPSSNLPSTYRNFQMTDQFHGALAELSIVPRALTSSEISSFKLANKALSNNFTGSIGTITHWDKSLSEETMRNIEQGFFGTFNFTQGTTSTEHDYYTFTGTNFLKVSSLQINGSPFTDVLKEISDKSWTYSMWFQTNASNTENMILLAFLDSLETYGLSLEINTSGHILLKEIVNDSGTPSTTEQFISTNFRDNNWHLLIISSKGHILVDGIHVLKASEWETSIQSDLFCIAGTPSGVSSGLLFQGNIGPILLFDRCLTSREINALVNYTDSLHIDSGLLFENSLEQKLIGFDPSSFSDTVNITVPSSVTTIGKGAFIQDTGINTFSGSSVTTIEEKAFFGSINLSSFDLSSLSSSFQRIEPGTFQGTSLNTIDVVNNVKRIEKNAFRDVVLSTITIDSVHDNLVYLGENVFLSSTLSISNYSQLLDNLKSVQDNTNLTGFLDILQKHYYDTVNNVTSLTTGTYTLDLRGDLGVFNESGVVYDSSRNLLYVTPDYDFETTSSNVISVASNCIGINSGAFDQVNNTFVANSVTFSGTLLTSFDSSAFQNFIELTQITIPSSVLTLGDSCFSNCNKMTSVTFDGTPTVTTFGISCFENCTSLNEFMIPNSVTTISNSCFLDCSGLVDFSIESGSILSTIGNTNVFLGTSFSNESLDNILSSLGALLQSSTLTPITTYTDACKLNINAIHHPERHVDFQNLVSNNFHFPDIYSRNVRPVDGVLYNYTYTEDPLTFDVASNLRAYGFDISTATQNTDLTNYDITIGHGCTDILSGSFQEKHSIKKIDIGNTVKIIHSNSIRHMNHLYKINFESGSTLEEIRNDAIRKNQNLTTMTIPSSVTTIETNAFYNSNISSFVFDGNLSSLENIGSSGVFYGLNLDSTNYSSLLNELVKLILKRL